MINTRKREREKEKEKRDKQVNTTKRDATKRLLKCTYSIFAWKIQKNRKFS